MKVSYAEHRECAKQQKVVNRRDEQCSQSIIASVLQRSPVMLDGSPVEIEHIGTLLENVTKVASKEIENNNNDPPSIDKSPTTNIEQSSYTNEELLADSIEPFIPDYILTVTEDEMDDDEDDAQDVETEKGIPPNLNAFSCSHNTTSEESAKVNHSETISAETVVNCPANIPTPISDTNGELVADIIEPFIPDYILTVTEDEMDDDDDNEYVEPEKGKPTNLNAFSCSHNTTSGESAKFNHSETISEESVVICPANIPRPTSDTNGELVADSIEPFIPDYGSKNSPTDNSNLDHVTKVIAYHPRYLDHFLNTQKFVMQCDGPLPYDYRNYIAIMAAARHKCTYLVNLYEDVFLRSGGDPSWLNGLEHIPTKLRAISDINKILAHRPWLLNKEHVERLTKGQNSWSLSEVVHAIVLLAHYHSLSSFVFSCGLTQELDGASHKVIENNNVLTQKTAFNRLNDLYNSQHPDSHPQNGADGNIRPEVSVDALMQRMKRLSEKNDEACSETELSNRFKNVEQQAAELPPVLREASGEVPQQIGRYVDDPGFTYQDFARRGAENIPQTFRIQDYSWDDHGYSLVNRLYNDVGFHLDDKFRAAYNLTYYTIAGRTNVDTSKFRRAIWNYIQCIYGIRHDDYDYGEVNQLLDRSLKMFIKTACCFPERITKLDYDSVLVELQHSEKVHINLMILEARNQAELLYALREIMRYMT